MEIETLLSPITELIPATHAAPALYMCWGGLVFVPLSIPFLEEIYGSDWEDAPDSILGEIYSVKRKFPDQQIVVVANILADEVNHGYDDEGGRVVKKVNGTDVVNLKHLLMLIQSITSGTITFECDEDVVLVFDVEEVNAKNEKILKTHKIQSFTNMT
eukprot:TRINITY_DN6413_c0_g1_i3.p1 TRINITY_DN6413_c0_g1~~TRINITY_DN6413_c0_g1_i3.p1  ORF type:complete len:158 (-),score=47.29 TRINITY_DN6413_c0_g1_i3:46-519(-)